MLTADDVSFGTLRILEVYRGEDGFESKVFRSEKEAVDWLRGGPT